jgi:glucokinase
VVAAVDIGGTKIAVGMIDDSGKVLSHLECPTDAHLGYAVGLVRITRMLRETARAASVDISGIGIGSTGMVYPMSGMFGDVDFLPGWKGFNLVEDLERAFKVKAALENDADASALGEASWGAGKGKSRLIYVTVGTGIGGGIILDGQIYRGADMSHPEIGHHVLETSGPLCSCGFRGCWESLATGPALAAWFQKRTTKDQDHGANITAKQICELARSGDEFALQAVEHQANYLGLGLANLINLFVPEIIVLGGSVMKSADLFFDGIRKVIRQGCRFVPFERTELAMASLGENANLIGAARVWHHRYDQGGDRATNQTGLTN